MRKLLLIFLTLILIGNVFAQDYYADILGEISENGETKLSGTTNHPLLSKTTSQEYTSKMGEIWKFDLIVKDTFTDYIYEIQFPQESEILTVSTLAEYRITTKEGKIVLIGTGENQPLEISVTYTIKKNQTTSSFEFILIIAIIIILMTTGGYLLFIKSKKKTESTPNKISYDIDALTERQTKIMELIEKNSGKITQAELQKTLNYPKAALSRNLQGLEKKGIIQKERKGMTMLVKLKEENKTN